MQRTTDRTFATLRDWGLNGALDRRVSLGLSALVLLLAVIGTWNSGPTLFTVLAAVCLVISGVGFVAAVLSSTRRKS